MPLQAFAPATAYAATPTAAELSEKNADKARAELLTAIGADLPGLYEDDTQQFLADATSQNTAWEGVSSQATDGTVQVATSDDSNITYTADGQPLYDSASDTIYIYNALQTAVSRQEDAADQPVLTGDGDAETFGTGQPIYAAGSDEPLTYSPEHTYVYADGWDEGLEDAGENTTVVTGEVSSQGSDAEPSHDDAPATQEEPTADEKNDVPAAADGVQPQANGDETVDQLGGRDYIGQTVKTIGDETYILIGNEQQLRAIGSDKKVTGLLYTVDQKWTGLRWGGCRRNGEGRLSG